MISNQAILTYVWKEQVIEEPSNLVTLLEMKPFLIPEQTGIDELTFYNTTNCPIFRFTVLSNEKTIHTQSYLAKNSSVTFSHSGKDRLLIHYQIKKNEHLERIYWLYDGVTRKRI